MVVCTLCNHSSSYQKQHVVVGSASLQSSVSAYKVIEFSAVTGASNIDGIHTQSCMQDRPVYSVLYSIQCICPVKIYNSTKQEHTLHISTYKNRRLWIRKYISQLTGKYMLGVQHLALNQSTRQN